MKIEKRAIKSVISVLMALVLVLGFLPGSFRTVRAEGAEELTDTIPGNQLLTIDNTDPEGFDPADGSNPYGSTEDTEGTLAIPWDELAVLTESWDEETNYIKWLRGDKGSQKDKALSGFDKVTSTSVAYENYIYVQSVAFDKSGSGRKDIVAYVGYNTSDKKYHLWTINTSDGNKTTDVVVDHWEWDDEEKDYKEHKPIFVRDGRDHDWQNDHFAANSLLSITAGDFGRGYETVVVTASFATRDNSGGSLVYSFEYYHDKDDGLLKRIGSNKLEWLDSKTYINTVSTAAGDLDGDGYDEFVAVLARSNGAAKGKGETKMLVYPGGKGKTGCIVNRTEKVTSLYKDFTPESGKPYRLSFAAPGVAIGDVDGDGQNEVVVAG